MSKKIESMTAKVVQLRELYKLAKHGTRAELLVAIAELGKAAARELSMEYERNKKKIGKAPNSSQTKKKELREVAKSTLPLASVEELLKEAGA